MFVRNGRLIKNLETGQLMDCKSISRAKKESRLMQKGSWTHAIQLKITSEELKDTSGQRYGYFWA